MRFGGLKELFKQPREVIAEIYAMEIEKESLGIFMALQT